MSYTPRPLHLVPTSPTGPTPRTSTAALALCQKVRVLDRRRRQGAIDALDVIANQFLAGPGRTRRQAKAHLPRRQQRERARIARVKKARDAHAATSRQWFQQQFAFLEPAS